MTGLRTREPVDDTGAAVLHGEGTGPGPFGLPFVLCEKEGAVLDPEGVFTTDVPGEVTCERCREIMRRRV